MRSSSTSLTFVTDELGINYSYELFKLDCWKSSVKWNWLLPTLHLMRLYSCIFKTCKWLLPENSDLRSLVRSSSFLGELFWSFIYLWSVTSNSVWRKNTLFREERATLTASKSKCKLSIFSWWWRYHPGSKHCSNHLGPNERRVNGGNLSEETIANNQYLWSIYNWPYLDTQLE